MNKKILVAFLASSLVGCGGSGSGGSPTDDDNSSDQVQTGVLVDSAVGNIAYKTATQEGRTNSAGEFSFAAGETVVFFVGGIQLPQTVAKALITPLDLADTGDINSPAVINIARTLQTLDSNGDPGDGISINEMAHGAAEGIDPGSVDFSVNPDSFGGGALANVWANAGSTNVELILAEDAITHLQTTLDELTTSFAEIDLAGKEFFNAYSDEDDANQWKLDTFSFAASGNGLILNSQTGTYAVNNGILNTDTPQGEFFIKVSHVVAEGHWAVCWGDTIEIATDCGWGLEYFFSTRTAAESYVDQKNGTVVIDPSTLEFSSAALAGDDFFNAYADDENNNIWTYDTLSFASNSNEVVLNGEPANYDVTNGILMLNTGGGDIYIRASAVVSDGQWEVCWGDTLSGANECSWGTEQWFTEESAAQAYIDSQNAP